MSLLIAKTVIHRTTKPGKAGDKTKGVKAIPPEQEVIQPGEVFEATSADERTELIGLGAAVDAPKDVNADTVKTAKGKAAAKAAVESSEKKEAAAAESDSGKSASKPSGKSGETTTTGKTVEGGDGSEMV